jgi:hypothetical protein
MAQGYQPGSWFWKPLDVTDQDLSNLHLMCDFFLKEQRTHKLMISGNWIYIYTQDPSLLDDIVALGFLDTREMLRTRVRLIGAPDTVVQKNPRYLKRSFLRNMGLTPSQKDSMFNFLGNQEKIRVSPSLKFAMSNQHITRSQDYFFIDHDDDAVLVMLSLIVPNIIRKTLPIISHK